MICKVWDHLTKHPKQFGKLCIKFKFTDFPVDIGLDVYKDPTTFLSALKEFISQDDVFWLKYLVEDIPACSKIVKRYTTNLAIRRQFSNKGKCMKPLT